MGEIADIQKPVMDWAERNGWIARRIQYIFRNGCPDALFSRNGVIILVEFKQPGKELDPHQARERKRFRECGTEIYKVVSVEQGITLLRSVTRD